MYLILVFFILYLFIKDSLLYIWDLATGEVVYGQRLVSVVAAMKWIEHKTENRRVVYELILGKYTN